MTTTIPLQQLLLNETEVAAVPAARPTVLAPELVARVRELLTRLPELAQLLEARELSVQRLKKLLFGPRTEKARRGGPGAGGPGRETQAAPKGAWTAQSPG